MKELIERYEKLGVKIWVEQGNLKFRAPKGTITEERKAELKENKEAIIDFLMKRESIVHDEKGRFAAFPLTDIQAAYLVGRSGEYGFGGVGCKVYLELTGNHLDVQRLNEAWKTVVDRHDMMRAIVEKNGTQRVLEEVKVPEINIVENEENALFQVRERLSTKEYDPQMWPLYDMVLVREEQQDVLCFSIDMLIADFTSITILLNELELIYNGIPLKEQSEITFRDIIMDQYSGEKDAKEKKAKEYWMERLENFPLAPELPVANKITKTTSVIQKNLLLSYEKWAVIEAFAKENKLTPASVMLNIYADVIARFSNNNKFAINVTMADRKNAKTDVSGLVGDFTIVDLLEIEQDVKLSFVERASKIKQQLWTDLENMSFSGVSVIRELKRVKETEVLYPVVFTSTLGYKAKSAEKVKDGLVLTYKISQTPQVWIDCQISEEKNGILVNWDVREGVFKDGLIEAAFEAFQQELNYLADQDLAIDTYCFKNQEEALEVRRAANATNGAIPTGLLQDEWLKNVKKNPDHVAVIEEHGSYTYRQLYAHALAISNEIHKRKIEPQTVIAVDMKKSVWSVAAALGIMMSGCVYLPLDHTQPVDRRIEILEQADTDIFIYEGKSDIETNHGMNVDMLVVDDSVNIEGELQNYIQAQENPAYIIFTSGSTGKPKGVVISHKAAKNTILDINERFSVTENDRCLALARNAFDLSIYDIFGLLSAGGAMVLPHTDKRKNPDHWYELIHENCVTIWNSVPAQMQMLTMYATSVTGVNVPLKYVFLSGDWIPTSLPTQIHEMSDAVVVSMGGATEAAIWSNFYVVSKGETFETSIPYGKPLKNQFFHVFDSNLEECPDWVTGELYIGGVGLANEYKNNQTETAARFIIHPVTKERLYKTGDLGRYMADGNIEFLGRVDNQVKIRGHRIEIQEIENKLEEMDGVLRAVVTIKKKDTQAVGLNAFVQLEEQEGENNTLVDEPKLRMAVMAAGEKGAKQLDRELFQKWTKAANRTAVCDIFVYLKSEKLFLNDKFYSMEDIFHTIQVHQDFKQLVIRWVKALCKEKYIEYDANKNAYRCVRHDIVEQTSKECWENWWKIEKEMNYSSIMVKYFQNSSNHLPQLIRKEIEALDIFFPQGDFSIAKAAYHDNRLSNLLNQVIIGAIRHIHDVLRQNGETRKVSILEVGAGVGGASLDVIPALAGYDVSYRFSDLSQYFLNTAKKNFETYDFVSYGIFDINAPYYEQGIRASQFDIIICNNVLHNAKSLPVVLQSFREILSPGGAFIIEDTTGENPSLLTSMEFHAGLSQFEDFRKESNEVFVTREQWREVLGNAGASIAAEFPPEEDPLAEPKQVVFVGQFVNHTKKLSKESLLEELATKVPEYMVPSELVILDKMPLNANGKLDRKAMSVMIVEEKNTASINGKELKEGLETRIGEIWKKSLNCNTIYREDNFYKIGGDSLLLAQVVSKMKESIDEFKDWGWNQIMTLILQNPTIAGIVQKTLEQPVEKMMDETQSASNLKYIKKVENSKRAIVLLHDGTGTISPFEDLIPYLEKESKDTVLGVYVNDQRNYLNYEDESLLKELGIKYANELKETGIETFLLVGYCMGGLVAVETAKNLSELGGEVEPVITIDTTPADQRIRNNILMERTFGGLLGADLTACGYIEDFELLKDALICLMKEDRKKVTDEDLASLDGRFAAIGENTKELLKKSEKERFNSICEHIGRLNEEMSTYQRNQLEMLYQVIRKSFSGMSLYGDEFYTGDVNALNCSDKTSNFLPILDNQNQRFWETITLGDLKTVTIEGNHLSCMKEPLVKNVADFILKAGE